MELTLEQRTKQYTEFIERYFEESCFCSDSEPQVRLFSAMRYSLLAGGKRLRPIFVFEFCRMCGGEWKEAVQFAAAVEMIHTYSLIHDDLPCMDNDDYRRGKPTNHKVFGEAMAVLAGDALLTAAFGQLSTSSFEAEVRIKAVEVLANCSGELGMVGGQVLDIMSEERTCTEKEVFAIQTRKTGALIRAACILGVLAGNGTQKQISAAAEFASCLGLAFQIRDDILDVIGSASELGKATGVDSSKNTFVRLFGVDRCKDMVRDYTDKAIRCLDAFEHNEHMKKLANNLVSRMI